MRVPPASARRNVTGETQVISDRIGGKYRVDWTDQEESAYENAD